MTDKNFWVDLSGVLWGSKLEEDTLLMFAQLQPSVQIVCWYFCAWYKRSII